jgi:hypothetical protein
MSDLVQNIILFIIRITTFGFAVVLSFNLLSDWRNQYMKETNGLRATRIAIMLLVLAFLIENGVYALAYPHGGFTTPGLNQWLSTVKPVVILSRLIVMFAFYKLFRLFCCNRKDK